MTGDTIIASFPGHSQILSPLLPVTLSEADEAWPKTCPVINLV